MKRKLNIALIGLALLVCVVGCSSDDKTVDDDTSIEEFEEKLDIDEDWQRINAKMTQAEVIALFGTPDVVMDLSPDTSKFAALPLAQRVLLARTTVVKTLTYGNIGVSIAHDGKVHSVWEGAKKGEAHKTLADFAEGN